MGKLQKILNYVNSVEEELRIGLQKSQEKRQKSYDKLITLNHLKMNISDIDYISDLHNELMDSQENTIIMSIALLIVNQIKQKILDEMACESDPHPFYQKSSHQKCINYIRNIKNKGGTKHETSNF